MRSLLLWKYLVRRAFYFASAVLVLIGALNSRAASVAESAERTSCDSLAQARIPGARIDESRTISDDGDLPSYCRVRGIVLPSIGFEMRLPVDTWNGRFLVAGCGAYCGQYIPSRGPGFSNSIEFAVRRGYAATQADSGHQTDSPTDTSWASNNPTGEALYAHFWVPLTAAASRAILHAYYGRGEHHAYFSGCSNGGRTAAKVAQLYPSLFDGIASGAPGINATYAAGVQGIWWDRVLVDEHGKLILGADRVPILAKAVLERCDAKDGLKDGIVSTPQRCDFRPHTLRCADGAGRAHCLSVAEVDVVEKLYAGPRDASGRQLYPGVPFGSEQYWPRWLIGPAHGGRPHIAELGTSFLRYLGFPEDPGTAYDSAQFDLGRDIPRLVQMGRLYNATEPDLSGLERAGGKLLMYHGLADALTLSVEATRYHDSVVNALGDRARVDEFYRLFLVPGMDHCWGVTGYAPDIFDPLAVLEDWVERGTAPTRIIATQYSEVKPQSGGGSVVRTRPLCAYPSEARYKGKGSPDLAENFECK